MRPGDMAVRPAHRMGMHPGPESEATVTARCLDGGGCAWETEPTNQAPAARLACETHTADTGHAVFAVVVEYVALVTATATTTTAP
ncbi:hypothetical protein [Streptomyces sp. CC208A]|uniref:hypothetical protein n=1 Tax=Streptomyces sp. CC208A TaxID=3044573 RepID=UPI0024A940CB|nr:hypothetical protein [Streptomyces sp. CC208A]